MRVDSMAWEGNGRIITVRGHALGKTVFEDEARVIQSWLSSLNTEERKLLRKLLKPAGETPCFTCGE